MSVAENFSILQDRPSDMWGCGLLVSDFVGKDQNKLRRQLQQEAKAIDSDVIGVVNIKGKRISYRDGEPVYRVTGEIVTAEHKPGAPNFEITTISKQNVDRLASQKVFHFESNTSTI